MTVPLLTSSRSSVSQGPPPPEQRSSTCVVPTASIARRIAGATGENIFVALAMNASQSVPPFRTASGHQARSSISTSCRRRTFVQRLSDHWWADVDDAPPTVSDSCRSAITHRLASPVHRPVGEWVEGSLTFEVGTDNRFAGDG